MVGPSTILSKSKEKQLAFNSEESDIECSSGLKEILIEPEGIYYHTRTQIGAVIPIDYNSLARGIEADDEHSNSYRETEAFT